MEIERINALAEKIMADSRNKLIVHMRFLDVAVSRLELFANDQYDFATDGRYIAYHPIFVLKRYRNDFDQICRDYLHMLFHCIFRHMYFSKDMDKLYWDLACDIAVENIINELDIKCVSQSRYSDQQTEINRLKQNLSLISAEKVYRFYKDSEMSEKELISLRSAFISDNHDIWYTAKQLKKSAAGLTPQAKDKGEASGQSRSKDNQSSEGKDSEQSQYEENQSSENGKEGQSQSEDQDIEGTDDIGMGDSSIQELMNDWKEISESIQENLETFSKQQGDKSGSLIQNLKMLNRERYDYAAFLKKFSVLGEVMKINDDEFDYIFYTYGMNLYKNMPLIEPLEYKEVKRIKEFVIAIDTSGSVSGKTVQCFVQKTYNILKQQENFFSKINLHIIQCDAEIQKDVKITSQDEFDAYIKGMRLFGFGGTDFRPVFDYVDELVRNKEFVNLKGLIYFTDGFGTFPQRKPDYQTAFVFLKDDYFNPDIPPWAIKLVLQTDEIAETRG